MLIKGRHEEVRCTLIEHLYIYIYIYITTPTRLSIYIELYGVFDCTCVNMFIETIQKVYLLKCAMQSESTHVPWRCEGQRTLT